VRYPQISNLAMPNYTHEQKNSTLQA